AHGAAKLDAVQAGPLPLDHLQFAWSTDGQRLHAQDFQASGPRGTFVGTCDLALDTREDSETTLQFTELDVGFLAAALGRKEIPVQGKVSGSLNVNRSGAPVGMDQLTRATFDLQSRGLRVEGVAVDGVQGKLLFDNHVLAYDVKGKTLDGQLTA